jgi:hypothetical protein
MVGKIMASSLEQIICDINYDDLGIWKLPEISKFSNDKNLWNYQIDALKNITRVLNLYYESNKKIFFKKYLERDIKISNIDKFASLKDKQKGIINKRFEFFKNYFNVIGDTYEEQYILGENFINRACFWMATGSGKSLVLIKTIELLDHLIDKGLIPKKDIMLLLPREDLIKQIKDNIKEFNANRERKIELISLKEYEEDKQNPSFDNNIKIYFYRSDLIRDKKKEKVIDYKSYQNNGNWYIFLDEAHRGEKEDSLMQDYLCVLSKNGFLFNFSATFTENIDFNTACYNFNLAKFINDGYGKNIYLSKSYFNFTHSKDDFSQRDKQKQVLKSLIIFVLVKKQKNKNAYHNPLLVTLVNSVNTQDSDLIMFFKKLEEIASGHLEEILFKETKEELITDFINCKQYLFNQETLDFDFRKFLNKIEVKDILQYVFNAKRNGKIEILQGDKGKEIVLKLETTDKPFALIKIGDTQKFQKQHLGEGYKLVEGFDNRQIFASINGNENINLLLGSRGFYEGWDSNRPNVINMINIGGKNAKKYVLQAVGRGIRIEPYKQNRKRLPKTDVNKNILLETLFVFATDKNSVKTIVETIKEQQYNDEQEISLLENPKKPFDLLIPTYKENSNRYDFAKFNVSQATFKQFKNYLKGLDKNSILINNRIDIETLNLLFEKIENEDFFQIKNANIYNDMNFLLKQIIEHAYRRQKYVSGIEKLTKEIIHFKCIKVFNLSREEVENLKDKVKKVEAFKEIGKEEIEKQLNNKQISFERAVELANAKHEESFRDLKIKKIAKHYYLPLIYSQTDKIDYISHIIKHPSEVRFINSLNDNIDKLIDDKNIKTEWMFSKIDESIDEIRIPYFYKVKNDYRNFFPDFIFWIKKGDDYKIVFIDPKGTSYTDYENKADEFKKLFCEADKPKVFVYKNIKITIDLKFITDDINRLSKSYRNYWIAESDFSFFR